MDEINAVPTPPEAGTEPQNGAALVTEPVSQEPDQPQASGQTQVEESVQKASSEPAARPRASDYYRERKFKKDYAVMMERINRLEQQNQELRKPAVAKQEVPTENIEQLKYEDPFKYIELREKELESKFNKKLEEFSTNIPQHIQQIKMQEEHSRKEQEALEKLFPKTPGVKNETLEDRIERDPVYAEKIGEIITEYGFEGYLNSNPDKAARAIVELYDKRYPRKSDAPLNPAAPKKEQLTSIVGGKTASNSKKTIGDVMSEIKEMANMVAKQPYLLNDPEYQAKRKVLEEQFSSLYASKRG